MSPETYIPNFELEHGSDYYLDGDNYLDGSDPIDALLIGLKDQGLEASLPDFPQQCHLVDRINVGSKEAARELVASYKGVVAAVAYPYKDSGHDSFSLLINGSKALIGAARSYTPDNDGDFEDYAVIAVNEALSSILFEDPQDTFIFHEENPTDSIKSFLGTLVEVTTPEEKILKEQQNEERAQWRTEKILTSKEREVLPLLHLTREDAASVNGLTFWQIGALTCSARDKLGAQRREELALMAFRRGVDFDISEIPGREEFSIRERKVAIRAYMTNEKIGEELGLSAHQVERTMRSLWEKTGPRTRAELVIMAHVNKFEPTEEEMAVPKGLEEFTETERDVLQLLHLPYEEIAGRLKKSKDAVYSSAQKAADKAGFDNIIALTVELHRRGIEFDVIRPERPLVELLNSHEMEVAELLILPYEEISSRTGLTEKNISDLVGFMKRKTGARTHQELALIMRMFDTGERREPDTRTNREKFAAKLGLMALDECDIEALLEVTTPSQRKYIEAYHLADDDVSWADISARYDVSKISAMRTANTGIKRMRIKLGKDPKVPSMQNSSLVKQVTDAEEMSLAS